MIKITEELESLFLDKVKTLLVQGKHRQTVKRRRTRKYIYYTTPDGDFALEGKEVTFHEDTANFLDGVPQYIMEMLFNSMSIDNAIKLLENQGYTVVDPTLVKDDLDANQGLSENAINLIKAKILGVEE
jgi:hypothetical protein